MELVKMELQGFKSFADKTTLTFDRGITAIVGPNGSGKSNISDAVRWVMGEQNVRQLRGQKAEDVIFAGTEKRRPRGAAEVSLYFDNSDGALEIDFAEVAVTRRLFRSGESEYYINKRPCRLKDIHMLFADTGIGQDSMAIIGQNRVDRILNSKPEERRVIFEEAAGISRYKSRKQEGLRKIAETERNLERIGDMMSVLEERLGPMAEQAEKLKTFRVLDGERISCEGTLTLQELRNNERLLSKAENNRLAVLQERDEAAGKLAGAEELRKKLMEKLEAEGEELRRLDGQALQARDELESMKSRHGAFLQRRETLAETIAELDGEKAVLENRQDGLSRRGRELDGREKARETELAAARKGLLLTEALCREAEEEVQKARERQDALAARRAERQQEFFTLRRDAEEGTRRLEENGRQCREAAERLAEGRGRAEAAARQNETEKKRLAELAAEAEAQKRTAEEARRRAGTCRREAAEAEEACRRLKNKADTAGQRIAVLESMEQEREGLGRPAKAVLDAKTPWRPAVCGVVGELCRVPRRYAAAVDAALGAAARYIVTETEEAAKSAVVYLQERRAGRTTFLPLDTISGRSRTADEERAAREEGVVGFASDVLEYDERYSPVFSFLLGKTLVAGTMETGSRIARKYKYKLRIVCLDGTQFNAGGTLTGGSLKGKEGSLISRRALLDELRQEGETTARELESRQRRLEELRHIAAQADRLAGQEEETWRNLAVELQKQQLQAKAAEKDCLQWQETLRQLEERDEELQKKRADLQADLVEKKRKLEDCKDLGQDEITKAERLYGETAEKAEKCRRMATEQQIAAATIEEQLRHVREEKARHGEDLQRQEGDWQRFVRRRGDMAEKQKETEAMLEELSRKIAVKERETAEKEAEKEQYFRQREDTFRRSQAADEEAAAWRERERTCSERLSAANVQMEKYAGEIRRGEELLALQGLTRQEAMERRRPGSLKELQETAARLKRQIAGLGQINPNAEEEYKAAAAQQEFYRRQCGDLEASRTKLKHIVDEIDSAMAEQFSAAVEEIGRRFQEIFSRLFGGGHAQVKLADGGDVLTAGIELWIQPPGKKQQQLSLLSGGERALTVIALLLAFLAYHPAPFCLFDEVDAALDEANVERMARYLKNYSGSTQFIVITHRRRTMEAANTLLGVTMEEKGVSRLLTVKVDELLQKGT